MHPPALEVRDLTVRYGAQAALDQVSCSAPSGGITAILGQNGAGKSTLLKCATGALRPDSGEVTVLGMDPASMNAHARSRIGVMVQDGGLASGATAGRLLRYAARLYDDPLPIDQLASELGIDEFSSTIVRRLSGGQRQRLALALALVGRPALVFLDEPTAGMDPAIRQRVRSLIHELPTHGTSVVVSTHLIDDVELLADHVVLLDRGKVAAAGSPRELVSSYRSAEGLVNLSATANGLRPHEADELAAALQRTAAEQGVSLQVSTGADSLERILLELSPPTHEPTAPEGRR